MSNYLAIATVTATFRDLIAQAIQQVPDLSAAPTVTTGRPQAPEPSFVGVNLYLYRVEANATLRNRSFPIPHTESDGSLVDRWQNALNLDYLLTFYGKGQQQEPERLMGGMIAALTETPILKPELVRQTISTTGSDSYLAASDLANQIETVRLTPIYLNLEELSKLWTVFFQVTHNLSIAYQASVVLIDSGEKILLKTVNKVEGTVTSTKKSTRKTRKTI
jgi:hypothetical protein